jgi:hypothetical protein
MLKTNRSRIIATVCVLALLLSGVLSALWYYNHNDKMAQVTHTYQPDQIPVSKAGFTVYSGAKYPFTISYPSDWKVNHRDFNHEDDTFFSYQVDSASPDLHALDISCLANPQHLNAQQWNEQFPDLTSKGLQMLTGGTSVFVSTEHGETGYTMYTAVSNTKVCEIVIEPANASNLSLISKVVNSFKWQN